MTRRLLPDLAFCNTSGMDGYALARTIRRAERDEGRTRIPIIVCTANALPGQAEICLAAGMDDYVAKPVRLAEPGRTLAHWLPLPEPTGMAR